MKITIAIVFFLFFIISLFMINKQMDYLDKRITEAAETSKQNFKILTERKACIIRDDKVAEEVISVRR